ncbi:Methyltransferase type 11 [Candidatus Nitrosotenuis uzonensis]|uniref:Methyltransferase type 11 n=2 Tax=Candidatus Nitrosotenuis uzonensis TaxID=1407055 RepID=A0A812F0Z4_9ARCH|nr:Methyltransferase type 11 [Candidatus Nitrosotenuis uzonensis]
MQMQPLDSQYWAKYAHNHKEHYNYEMAKFVSDLAVSLRAQSVLEVGCSAGNDLSLLEDKMQVAGIDSSEHAILQAKKNFPHIQLKVGSITSIPHDDCAFDFVFTRNVFNYLADDHMQKATDELFRVSKKYIMNIEMFSENDHIIEKGPPRMIGRNMKNRWLNYKVKIISDVNMHEEIDPKRSRFVLVRKM